MATHSKEIVLQTEGEGDVQDITQEVISFVKGSGIKNGLVNASAIGSTCAITTIEYEPGLKKDLLTALERLAPKKEEYEHHRRWGDFNGHSHIRASVIGPSLTIPIEEAEPVLGTWQQVVFVELDVRPRSRRIHLTALGDP
jgi:secondary thiamine-phosphate synthase enzyme